MAGKVDFTSCLFCHHKKKIKAPPRFYLSAGLSSALLSLLREWPSRGCRVPAPLCGHSPELSRAWEAAGGALAVGDIQVNQMVPALAFLLLGRAGGAHSA